MYVRLVWYKATLEATISQGITTDIRLKIHDETGFPWKFEPLTKKNKKIIET